MLPYGLIRPFLFALDAERAHDLTLSSLTMADAVIPSGCGTARSASPIEVMGLKFPNRVGLAAGLDKNGSCIDGLAHLGFGFLEIGTVTPRPQPGNPKPRLFRLPEREAIINRMGFNNDGVVALVDNVHRARYAGVLGINIGKNADTPIERAAEDYLACLDQVYAAASYVTVNISSPNTANLRQLQGESELDALLAAIKARQAALADRHGRYVPVALKIAPDLDAALVAHIADTLRRNRCDAVVATNTTTSREEIAGDALAGETGGLSGAPLFESSTAIVAALARALAGEVPIIAAGGIVDGGKAKAKLEAGASLVQLYSGLIFRGPALVRECIAATA
jgi:dihydroorotate dehydrogenase